MGEFSTAMKPWIDRDGLVGTSPDPTQWSGGNQILDTSIACIMEVELNGWNSDNVFLISCRDAIAKCKNLEGSFDKNPGRPDAFSHDDRLGMVAASRVCGFSFAKDWVDFGLSHDWMMSNTGVPYWDADTKFKRWERAFHLLCRSRFAGLIGMPLLLMWVIFNAWFGDVSAHRLMYACTRPLKGYGFFTGIAVGLWGFEMEAKYDNPGNLMGAYLFRNPYAEIHPFVVHGRKLRF